MGPEQGDRASSEPVPSRYFLLSGPNHCLMETPSLPPLAHLLKVLCRFIFPLPPFIEPCEKSNVKALVSTLVMEGGQGAKGSAGLPPNIPAPPDHQPSEHSPEQGCELPDSG